MAPPTQHTLLRKLGPWLCSCPCSINPSLACGHFPHDTLAWFLLPCHETVRGEKPCGLPAILVQPIRVQRTRESPASSPQTVTQPAQWPGRSPWHLSPSVGRPKGHNGPGALSSRTSANTASLPWSSGSPGAGLTLLKPQLIPARGCPHSL
jgi:hypothetical protein